MTWIYLDWKGVTTVFVTLFDYKEIIHKDICPGTESPIAILCSTEFMSMQEEH